MKQRVASIRPDPWSACKQSNLSHHHHHTAACAITVRLGLRLTPVSVESLCQLIPPKSPILAFSAPRPCPIPTTRPATHLSADEGGKLFIRERTRHLTVSEGSEEHCLQSAHLQMDLLELREWAGKCVQVCVLI